ncbi:helix-turn-helix domain-containing protein [Paenibacillus sp. JSM ZJ436]|uniref:helix-turn-helix domain-containing protein n=1 Tax=Paenibacillus sp. JSM ZJ436 TaxID=3376190 RepID=UPI0037A605A7
MRPKEIQERLGIDADRIKLFKREGIFFPENPPSGNRSTNYTQTDCENLRLLVVLTKSGLTCRDIRRLQNGKWTLKEAIVARKQSIDAEIARKRNSLALLELLDSNAEFETFETERYWNVIAEKEAAGEKFIDIEVMYDYRSVSLIRNIRCPHCGEGDEVNLEDYMYDQSSNESENGMGPDIVYSFNSENSYECPECSNVIKIEGWIREYPMGAYDSEDITVEERED